MCRSLGNRNRKPIATRQKNTVEKIGPGSELRSIIPKFFESEGCECRSYAAKMDRWGVDGCERRFDSIVSHLVSNAKQSAIISLLGPINELVAKKWLRQAIDAAKKHSSQATDQTWFVAVTTAPRKDCTLVECIESLRTAGWEPTIFAEPGSTTTDAETVWNDQRRGCWHNWLASARYALENSNASAILTVQDDSEFHPDSRSFSESILWPSSDSGFVSLYTPKHYSLHKDGSYKSAGVNRITTNSLWGACALIWPREVLAAVIDSHHARTWAGARPRSGSKSVMESRRANPWKIANSDTAIGQILNKMKRNMWFVDPSPVRHIAAYSAIGHGDNSGRRNCIRCADHSIHLADQVPACVPVKLQP